MTSRDFVYWLQGYFEISGNEEVTKEQALVIKNHLNMVFRHEIDPSMGSVAHQKELNEVHNSGRVGGTIAGQVISGVPATPFQMLEYSKNNYSLNVASC